jgi:ABC-type transporter Mla subunit MlaD
VNFKLKHANKLVAVFILIAILIIVATMVFTGDITELFSEKYYFTSIFKDTSGLSPGIPVKLIDLDIEIGKVDNVESNNVRGQVKVEYSVIRSYADRYLKKDSVVFYSEGVPIVGKATLLLTIGEETQPLIPLNKKK